MNRTVNEQYIAARLAREVQKQEAIFFQEVDDVFHVAMKVETEDRITVKLGSDLRDGTKPFDWKLSENHEFRAFDVHFYQINSRSVNFLQ
jgi:hypothetical protein